MNEIEILREIDPYRYSYNTFKIEGLKRFPLRILNAESDVKRLYEKDDVLYTGKKIEIMIDFPLRFPALFEFTNEKGYFTLEDVVLNVYDAYMYIYTYSSMDEHKYGIFGGISISNLRLVKILSCEECPEKFKIVVIRLDYPCEYDEKTLVVKNLTDIPFLVLDDVKKIVVEGYTTRKISDVVKWLDKNKYLSEKKINVEMRVDSKYQSFGIIVIFKPHEKVVEYTICEYSSLNSTHEPSTFGSTLLNPTYTFPFDMFPMDEEICMEKTGKTDVEQQFFHRDMQCVWNKEFITKIQFNIPVKSAIQLKATTDDLSIYEKNPLFIIDSLIDFFPNLKTIGIRFEFNQTSLCLERRMVKKIKDMCEEISTKHTLKYVMYLLPKTEGVFGIRSGVIYDVIL